MTVSQAADQLIQIIRRRKEEGEELGESQQQKPFNQYFSLIPDLFWRSKVLTV